MLQQSFFQKLMLMIFFGFMAACGVWVLRHIVQEAFWETGAGWKESLYDKPHAKRPR
jgi:hypothetical protein